ncbi:MAG: glycosyl hydrolase family 18 protein [Thermoanaerobaculia bacterium]
MMKRFSLLLLLLGLLGSAPAYAYRVTAWVPPWDSEAYETLQLHAAAIDESNPTWYSMTADGSIKKNWNAENETWRAAMSAGALVPTIQNFVDGRYNADVLTKLLATEQSREAHAEAITRLAIEQALDGIDIDYEALPATERERFSLFIELLAGKLHATGRTLSVTVHAKTSDSQNWKGPGSQDWSRIGAVADSVKIMAYDYHWATSAPGAIAPLAWIEAVTAYAVSTIPAEKVILGLPWYGYDWSSAGGDGITWTEAVALAQANGATITRDANGEATFTYVGHTVFFQDAESYRRKVQAIVAKYPAIGGFAHWRAGGEDPAIWNVIAEVNGGADSGGSGGSGAAPVPGTFTTEGPDELTIQRGDEATVSWQLVPIDGFTGVVGLEVTSLGGLPGSATLIAPAVTANGTATLAVRVDRNAAPGTYRIDVSFKGDTMALVESVEVHVEKASRGRLVRR